MMIASSKDAGSRQTRAAASPMFSLIAGMLPTRRRRSKPAVLLIVLTMAMHGGATTQADPPLPVIPATNFNITSFGAYADGVSNNAAAIQNTINAAAAAGGGTVVVAAVGVLTNYLSGPITLTNRVSLQINGGAMLQMLSMSNWPSASTPFINGSHLHDVEINGSGTIDGQGTNWWLAFHSNAVARPLFINFGNCSNVLIQAVTLQNPPEFHMMLKSENVNLTIQNITINTPGDSPNTDGMDLASTNVLIRNCSISDGDDNIEIGGSGGLANTTVSNCTFGTGDGCSIGSITSGGVNGVLVSNCTFNGTKYGIHLKSDNSASGGGSGGLVQNVLYTDITMTNVGYAIVVYSYYNETGTPDIETPAVAAGEALDPVTATTVIWSNITIANVTATGLTGKNVSGIIWGRLEMPVFDLTLTNVNITAPTKTFCVYNTRGLQIIDSNLGDPNSTTNTFTIFNAQMTITNSAPNTNPVTLTGLDIPPTNNILAFFNAQAAITATNMLGPDPYLTLGASTFTVKTNLNLGAASTLNFGVGTNATELAVTGNLSVNGTLNITDAGGFTATTYTLFTYTGALLENGLTIGTAPALYNYAINTNTLGQVNLVVTPPLSAFQQWQLQYFGCTNDGTLCTEAAPNADPLGKGMSNTNQFLAGFDPTNPAAYLHVISIAEQSVVGNTNIVVTYLGANGDDTYAPGIASRTNVLDYMTGDASGNYTNGGWLDTGQTNILSGGNGSGAVTNMTDTAIPGASTNRYYRVRVLLP